MKFSSASADVLMLILTIYLQLTLPIEFYLSPSVEMLLYNLTQDSKESLQILIRIPIIDSHIRNTTMIPFSQRHRCRLSEPSHMAEICRDGNEK